MTAPPGIDNGNSPPRPAVPDYPPRGTPHAEVIRSIHGALFALPSFFKSDLVVTEVLATDLFSFNASLGATIESQVVSALNELRTTWDPGRQYNNYRFVRQSQRFPDVVLRSSAPAERSDIIMGIELKGWYLLAKEREPSFRYVVTPAVCAAADLLVVFPWALSRVISGTPQIFQPYIIPARFAAEYRNWHWQYARRTGGDRSIAVSSADTNYPAKRDRISDVPALDGGGNFGRLARTQLMDDYMEAVFQETLSGIPVSAWQRFLSIFKEERSNDEIERDLDRLTAALTTSNASDADNAIAGIRSHLLAALGLLEGGAVTDASGGTPGSRHG
jgi:hypothetical protein